MSKLNNSQFETIESIIKNLNIKYDEDDNSRFEAIKDCWVVTIGNKISQYAKIYKIDDEVVTIVCSDSYVANELFNQKEKIIEIMNRKLEKLGIKILDLKIDYRKWIANKKNKC